MKKVILSSILLAGVFTACSPSEGTDAEGNASGKVLTELPGSAEMSEAMDMIIKKAGFSSINEVEFFELGSNYTPSIIDGNDAVVYVEATLVDKKDKNKLLSYTYMFSEGTVGEGEEVILTSGIGSSEEIVEGYEVFKSNLFKISDIPSFSKMDDMKKIALEKSGYKKEDQYISSYTSEYSRMGRFETDMTVRHKKVNTMSKTIYFDKNGDFLK